MEWEASSRAAGNQVSLENLKVCELCGTLNHHRNTECFTCGWRGRFSRDEATSRLAWLRLVDQYEEVRMEHVTAKSRPIIGDFGRKRPAGRWQHFCEQSRSWWQGVLAGRVRSEHDQSAHRQHITPQKDLGGV